MAEKKRPLAKFTSKNPAEQAIRLGFFMVRCPYCKAIRRIEPDGNYDDIECEGCGKHYRTRGVI